MLRGPVASSPEAGGGPAGRVVAALVHAQVVLAAEGHGAEAAGEGPLARVAALVPRQVAGAAEALRAEAARVRQLRGGPACRPAAATGGCLSVSWPGDAVRNGVELMAEVWCRL